MLYCRCIGGAMACDAMLLVEMGDMGTRETGEIDERQGIRRGGGVVVAVGGGGC